MEERLQKILARAGYGSRRACEEFITAGRVRVNGQAVTLGSKADPARDHITLDGVALPKAEPLVYYALHKPRGVITSVSDPLNRPTVRDLLPMGGTLYPVGRLDEDSEGLILMTNDGELANRLTHPKYGHEKEYKVLVARQPDEQQLEAFRHGVILEDGYRTAPAQVFFENTFGKGAWLRVILREGRKRQIREMGERIGLPIVRIVRVRIGAIRIGSLKTGEWRALKPDEVRLLKQPLPTPVRPPSARPHRAFPAAGARPPAQRGPGGPASSPKPAPHAPGRPPFRATRSPRPASKPRGK